MKTKIFLDTNFLLIPALFKVDIFAEIERVCDFNYELLILDKTIDELNNILSTQRGKHKAAAKLAFQLTEQKIKAKQLEVIETKTEDTSKNVDRLLLEIAKHEKIIVATQDKVLKQYLRLLGAKILDLRKKQYLVLL